MDFDDDDIYPEQDSTSSNRGRVEASMRDVEDGEEEGEEIEDDSDDDINFIVDAKEEAKSDSGPQSKLKAGTVQNDTDPRKVSSTPTPAIKRENTPVSNINRIATPLDDNRPGTDYPARHTSTLDPLNGNPIHPTTAKPILSTDLDVDFPSESSKPWRNPGADVTDFFNYGFDEFTWASYCLKKQQMPQEIKQINQEAEQMKAFVEGIGSGGGLPGMPGMPGANGGAAAGSGGMPQMPGMPSEQDMQQMFQTMMAQGMDPSSMDSNQFMQMMMAGGGGGQFSQGQQPPAGPAGFGGGGGGYQDSYSGGRGRGRGGRRNW